MESIINYSSWSKIQYGGENYYKGARGTFGEGGNVLLLNVTVAIQIYALIKIYQTTSDTFHQSQHLLYTLHKFFLFRVSVVIFTFLEIIKHNMLKCYFFPAPFNIKMATQKFINFDKFLKNACWYDSCHNTIQQNFFQWS